LGCARNVAAAAGEEVSRGTEPTVNGLSNCLTYRQVGGGGFGAGSAPARRVPVLFSTNRGLYLRVAQPQTTLQPVAQHYDINFCDLERWSTNRANVVSLEDTFSILKPGPHPHTDPPHPQSNQPQRDWNNLAVYKMQPLN
ncbi:GH17295, partial [Drosophila grimshawi]